MKLIIYFCILTTFYCKCLGGEHRISEIKCHEYSTIPLNSVKPQPHLLWLRIATENIIVVGVIGTLISEQFVLTSAVSNLIVNHSQVYFTPDDQYNIVERFTHPFYGQTAHHDIALLKLERAIELDDLHRPACLWTSKYFESATAELINWNSATWTDVYEIKTLNIITGSECTGLHSQQNESLICIKPIASEDHHYVATPGSPVQIYKPHGYLSDNYYIYGIFSFFYHNADPYINIATKTYVHLNWIESRVWPNEACGNVSNHFRSSNPSTTLAGEFPWHAALFQTVRHGGRNYKCDGILLNELTVLTAARCVSNPLLIRSPGLLIAIMGLYDLEILTVGSHEVRINRIIFHNQVENMQPENNLAVLKLAWHAILSNYVQPICLSSNPSLFENRVGVLPGWGQMNFDMGAINLSKGFLSMRNATEYSFSAVYQNATGACSGNLGGGLVIEVLGRWYLKGIMSNAASSSAHMKCELSILVSFTDAVKWNKWIQDNMLNYL